MNVQNTPDIIYTKVDEAPELASASFLPRSSDGIDACRQLVALVSHFIFPFP